MSKQRCFTAVIALIIITSSIMLKSEDKLGQTGFQFLSVANDARAAGMAEAVTGLEMNSTSLFFNPAGMARMENNIEVSFSQNQWIANIKHNALCFAIAPKQGRYGVIGLTFRSIDYGEIQGTKVWENTQGYLDTELMYPAAFSAGAGYAKYLTDKFSVGAQVNYTGQYLGKSTVPSGDTLAVKKNLAFSTAIDFGTLYHTGFKSLMFGMSVRNFSQEVTFEEESFQLPLTFNIGVSMNVLDLFDMDPGLNSCVIAIDASHPRSYPELLNIGLEYLYLNTFAVRCGYKFVHDEQKYSFGVGVRKFGITVDYAYTPFGVFDTVQRFTFKINI